MHVQGFALGAFQTNCYVLTDKSTKTAIIIDPGYNPDVVLDAVDGYKVTHILLTHAHLDHIGGLKQVKQAAAAPVYVHPNEEEWLINPMLNGSGRWLQLGEPITGPAADKLISEGDKIPFAGKEISVLFVPGHSPGSVAYVLDDLVFAGDTLFYGSIGRTDLPGGDFDTLTDSIRTKLYKLPPETVVYPGHGPETTVKRERKFNPFVRDDYVYDGEIE
ncbi:MBL fold metallo-hydrolase [Effusibacillus lacus]|uniref:Metal-binding protein n=1 Tax=Effusibacillus lacus TaxID=1348429 RepID=A0A292YTQ7_9BACL|nr:MBL fold metallo-hydrolase [Effusibacillus lacus]TCS76277.1 glyoxylase-like metal-dependent hydrolase (beta-lactamase superfamily II) [Effusibacillus lacus]GAX91824.1 metal-binding protein [Effusibacillus lacus]